METIPAMDEPPKFAADRMMARLARWLRLLGADVICDDGLDGAAMLRRARAERRIMLTRDKRLRTAPDLLYLEANDFRAQLRAVLIRYPFDVHRHAFTRCSRCNAALGRVAREAVGDRVPPYVLATQENFAQCDRCGRIYWEATHPERARREIDRLMGSSGAGCG
jgi:uncharacterized protein with PIN domain